MPRSDIRLEDRDGKSACGSFQRELRDAESNLTVSFDSVRVTGGEELPFG